MYSRPCLIRPTFISHFRLVLHYSILHKNCAYFCIELGQFDCTRNLRFKPKWIILSQSKISELNNLKFKKYKLRTSVASKILSKFARYGMVRLFVATVVVPYLEPAHNNLWSHWYSCLEFWLHLVFHGW